MAAYQYEGTPEAKLTPQLSNVDLKIAHGDSAVPAAPAAPAVPGPKHADEKLQRVQQTVSDVREAMKENIEKIIKRGDDLDVLIIKSGDLKEQSFRFSQKSKDLRCRMCLQNYKMWGLGLLIVGIIIMILYFAIKAN